MPPFLFISARLSTDDILLALNIGGDDYITKSYELSILLAKIKARLSRQDKKQGKTVVGDLEFDFEKRKVYKNGVDLELKNKEFLLLTYLAQNADKALTKDAIFSAVWGDAFFFGRYADGAYPQTARKNRRIPRESRRN